MTMPADDRIQMPRTAAPTKGSADRPESARRWLLGAVAWGVAAFILLGNPYGAANLAQARDQRAAPSLATETGERLAAVAPVANSVKTSTRSTPARKLRVVFLNPASAEAADEEFWRLCTIFMQAAADDLGIDLKTYYAQRSAATLYAQATMVLNSADKPDFLVMQNLKKTAPRIIEEAEAAGVKVLLFNSGLGPDELGRFGGPRQIYKNWIGQLLPDDERAGYELAELLVSAARNKGLANSQGQIEMLAIGGTGSDSSAEERNRGLQRFLREQGSRVRLARGEVIPAYWETAKAGTVFDFAASQNPQLRVVWAANDNMALGALQAARERGGFAPGESLLIGGIDWNKQSLAAVRRGDLLASLGGHYMEGAWAMVLLRDYADGIDFAGEGLTMTSRLHAITAENLARFENALGELGPEAIGKVDFARFAKSHNRALKKYRFDLQTLLGQFK